MDYFNHVDFYVLTKYMINSKSYLRLIIQQIGLISNTILLNKTNIIINHETDYYRKT